MALIKCAHCGKHENINKAIDMESEGYFCFSCGNTRKLTELIMEKIKDEDNLNMTYPEFVKKFYSKKEECSSPSYYIGKYKGIKAIDIVQDFELTHNLANAVEYILRAGKKSENPIEQDLSKAIDHLRFELNFLSLQKESLKKIND